MTLTTQKITSCLEKCGEYSHLADVMINKCLLMDKLRQTSQFIKPGTTYHHLADYLSLLLITCPYRSRSKNPNFGYREFGPVSSPNRRPFSGAAETTSVAWQSRIETLGSQ